MELWNGLLKPLRRRAYLSTGERKIFQRSVALSRRIRVLEVVRPAAGGMKKHVQGLVQGLDKDRFEVFLAAPKDEESSQWAGMEGVECILLEISGRTPAPGDVIACLKLRNLIKAVRPDICHFHGFKAAAIGRVAVALCSSSVPVKFRWHSGASTTERSASNVSVVNVEGAELAAADVGTATGSVVRSAVAPQVVYTVHNSVLSRSDAHLSPPSFSIGEHLLPASCSASAARSSITRPTRFHCSASKGRFSILKDLFDLSRFQGKMCLYTEHALARFTHRVIAVSQGIYQEYSAIPRLGPGKVRHIPNGIDLKQFCMITLSESQRREKAKKDMGCAIGIPVVGLVSRLIPHKGVKTFLLAMASLRQVGLAPQVLIAGDGPSRVELEAFSLGLGLGNQVRFLGFIDDMVSFYAALDVFVLSSLSEGMPLSLIEAMAAGVPVVATRTGGVEEVVSTSAGGSEGVTISDRGRLVPPGDPEAMATCIRNALLFPHESRMLADKARAYVRENFSLGEMVRKTEEVYEEVLACRD